MKDINCEEFIRLDTPDALVLAILCDFKDKNEQDVVNYIIKRLYDLTGENEKEFRKYMSMLEELSDNRDLKENIKKGEQMLTEINYEKLPSYELGFEMGEEKGIEKGMQKVKMAIVKKSLLKGLDIDTIAELTDLSKEEVINIAKEIKLNIINLEEKIKGLNDE